MGFMDKVGEGLEQAAKEIEKALEKGKTKVGEIQIEMQMDGLAKKLGYLVFDFYRGRTVDQTVRQKVLDDLTRLEEQLWKIRAEAAAKAEADAQARAAREQATWGEPGAADAGTTAGPDAAVGEPGAAGAGQDTGTWPGAGAAETGGESPPDV
jgi:hypothetical protein